jgi:UDP-N-acetylmuramate dehydrogenase
MKVSRNISLKEANTFSLEYNADTVIDITSEDEASQLFRKGDVLKRPLLVLGGGSNILFTGDFKGTIIRPLIEGIKVEKEDGDLIIVSAGAGEKWDHLVDWCVKRELCGLENLSLIPGNVGATPVQNIGAYGIEVKDVIERVETISISDGSARSFNKRECLFGYRSSIFKNELKGKYLITRVQFRLSKIFTPNLGYGSLKDEAEKRGNLTLENIRNSVIDIRRSKLPDPEVTGNAGSFFKNPIVSISESDKLKLSYPLLPVYYDAEGFVKLAAGWLIEHCGWKGVRRGDAGVHDKQALVLVNHGKSSGTDIYNLSEEIKYSVKEKFGIDLECEVEII